VEKWDIETTAEREHTPIWLVEIAQLWTAQSTKSYQKEYQEIRRLARASNVPPFVIILRMFRDTYHVTETTTQDQFVEAMNQQMDTDGGQMFMELATWPSEEAQLAAYAQELREKVEKAVETMQEAINEGNNAKFQEAAAISGHAQKTWLVVTQKMTPEQAHAVVVDFAHNEMTRWMEERRPGPPPLIFERYKHQ
jgi:hypothetical protein